MINASIKNNKVAEIVIMENELFAVITNAMSIIALGMPVRKLNKYNF